MRSAPILLAGWLLLPLAAGADAPRSVRTGIYNLEVQGGLEGNLALARKGGFGLAMIGAFDQQLDMIGAAGMKAVVALWLDAEAAKSPDKEKWEDAKAKIKEKVERLKSHPALYAWYVVDEPDGDAFPIAKLAEARDLIRSIDARTPLLAVFDKPREWAAYFPYFDIVCVDPYLRRRRIRGGYETPAVVTEWLKIAKQDMAKLGGERKLCAVLGAFDIRAKDAGETPGYRKPTPGEFKEMTARSLAEGVDEIYVYAYALDGGKKSLPWLLPKDDSKLWQSVQESMRALARAAK